MSYYINKGESVGAAVKRITLEQTEKALQSADQEEDVHEAIHDVRKRLKKIRAVLRLVRDDTGKDFYKEKNIFYRDLGRMLAPLRDARKRVELIGDLRQEYGGAIDKDWEKHVPAWIEEKERIVVREKLENEDTLKTVRDELQHSINSIAQWPVSEDTSFDAIFPGLKRVYKRGFKAYSKAYKKPDDKKFHEFRKRAKYLWYHIRLLKMSWSPVLKRWAGETHKLATLLGNDHDLTVLENGVAEIPSIGNNADHPLNRIIRSEREKYRQPAGIMAGRIYHEKPKRFTKRMAKYWEMWQKEDNPD